MGPLEELVQRCREAAGEGGAAAVGEVLAAAVGDRGSARRHGLEATERSAFVTLHRSPDLTIQHVVLPPGALAAPHDHRMWAVIGVYAGQEDNAFYELDVEQVSLHPTGGIELRAGEVLSLKDDVIHGIVNPSSRYTAALHVYGGDLLATDRTTWDANGAPHPLDLALQASVVQAAQGREEELGRGLTRDETLELLASLVRGRP